MMFHRVSVVIVLAGLVSSVAEAGSPTGWDWSIVPTGEYRKSIQEMPIEARPGRPLHVYGNSVRYFQQSDGSSQTRPLRWNRPVTQIVLGTDRLRDELAD